MVACTMPMVTVICKTYNQEKYIAQALESFVQQKTSFPFEVIVHDDASTDATAEIIREYEQRYPHIIHPIYQVENQHSKGVDSTLDYIIPKALGKYIAICEGDDFWTESTKLQKQFDYLEGHPDCPLVIHKTKRIFEDGSYLGPFSSHSFASPEACDLTASEVIRYVNDFHTSSLFFRKEYYNRNWTFLHKITPFDYAIKIMLATELSGAVHMISEVMSAYRVSAGGSWSRRIRDNNAKYEQHILQSVDTLHKIDEYRQFRYADAIQAEIIRREFKVEILRRNRAAWRNPKYRKYIDGMTNRERISNFMALCTPRTFELIHRSYQHVKKYFEH